MNKSNKIACLLLACLIAGGAMAQVSLPNVITDNMVLQQETDVALWGKGVPQKKVSIRPSWDKNVYDVTVKADSTWRVKVRTPKGSYQKYSISFTSGVKRVVNNVLVGEVWLASGQSNMEMPMKGFGSQPIEGGASDILFSANDNIRFYTVKRESRIEEQYDTQGKWSSAGVNTTSDFSATGYYFARALQAALNIPVAVLHSSWGGSKIEAWIPEAGYSQLPGYTIPRTKAEVRVQNQDPCLLWNGMLNNIAGYTIKGAVWYQGESNRLAYKQYPLLFKVMHEEWIKRWDCGTFPIYFCQIAPYNYGEKDIRYTALFREAQEKIALTQPNTGMACLMDAGEPGCIHPAKKREAGERLAALALNRSYGCAGVHCFPGMFDKAEFKAGEALVKFDAAPLGVGPLGVEVEGFELAGADMKFYPAVGRLNSRLGGWVVKSEQVPNPVAVRYCFEDAAHGKLVSGGGLPISSFRSDDWDEVR